MTKLMIGFLADLEDVASDAMVVAPLDDSFRRSDLGGASRNIDTCEDPVNRTAGYLGDEINVQNDAQMPFSHSHSEFGKENGGSSRQRLPFDGAPAGRNESIHDELTTRESSCIGDASSMVLSSLASTSNHTLAASNAACLPIRHRHQSSLLRRIDAAEPSVDNSDRLSVNAPGHQPDDTRSAHVVGQTEDESAFTQPDVEDIAEERHTGGRGASRRDDGMSSTSLCMLFGFRAFPDYHNKGDEGQVGNIRTKHGSMTTPQIIPHSIYNANEDTLTQNGQYFEPSSRASKRRRIMPESATSDSVMSSVISGRLNLADLESRLNPDEGAIPTSGSPGWTGHALRSLYVLTLFDMQV